MEATFKAVPGQTLLNLENGIKYHVSRILPTGTKGEVAAYIRSDEGTHLLKGFRGKFHVVVVRIANEARNIYEVVNTTIPEIQKDVKEFKEKYSGFIGKLRKLFKGKKAA